MTFEELLDMQFRLNNLAETPPDRIEDIDECLKTAIAVEAGEALQTAKSVWAWWTRYGKKFDPPNKGQLLGELADVFHFLLTGDLLWGTTSHRHLYEQSWTNPMPSKINHRELRRIPYYCEDENIGKALRRFIAAVRLFGFTREELEQAYRNKAQENIMRFTQTIEAKN